MAAGARHQGFDRCTPFAHQGAPVIPADAARPQMGGVLARSGLGFIQCVFSALRELAHGHLRFGHGEPRGEGDGVVGHIVGKTLAQHTCQFERGFPRAKQEEVVATGKDGVGVPVTGDAVRVLAVLAEPRQPEGEEGIDLARE